MPLTCDCSYEPEAGDKIWEAPLDYSVLRTCRRKRCSSCKSLIDLESVVAKFNRFRIPEYEIETAIYGEDGQIDIAPIFLCERCADLFFSLDDLGFCVSPLENQLELVKEYAELIRRQNTVRGSYAGN